MIATIQISHRTVGQVPATQPLSDWVLELLHEELTVAQLIRQVVEEEIQHHAVVRHWKESHAYLSPQQVSDQAASGMVKPPAREYDLAPTPIDVGQEVEKALQAFEARAYILLIDGQQPERLEELITLRPNSKITFLRLIPLVGG